MEMANPTFTPSACLDVLPLATRGAPRGRWSAVMTVTEFVLIAKMLRGQKPQTKYGLLRIGSQWFEMGNYLGLSENVGLIFPMK